MSVRKRIITHYKIQTDGYELDVYPVEDGVSVLIDGDEDGGLWMTAEEAYALSEALAEVATGIDAEKAASRESEDLVIAVEGGGVVWTRGA